MMKRLLILLFTSVLAFPPSTLMIAQDAPMKAVKEARWQGTIIRSNPDKSTLTVRDRNGIEISQYEIRSPWWLRVSLPG
jgi:hypothetical protein